jgi:hypothetical protein
LINTICDNCLLEAYLLKHSQVTAPIVENVASDLGLCQQPAQPFKNDMQDLGDIEDIDEMLDSLERKF